MPRQKTFMEADRRLAVERQYALQGSARIKLDQLDIGSEWQLNQKKIEALRQTFRVNGIYPLQRENHVEATVSRQDLEYALNHRSLTAHDFRIKGPDNYPVLDFSKGHLRCLHGKHRIQAARDDPPLTKWWIVDIYLNG